MTDPTRSAAHGWLAGVLPSARPPPGEGIHLGKNGEGEGGGEGGSEYLSGENREREPSGFSVIQLVQSRRMQSFWFPSVLSRNRISLCESCSSTVASPDRIQRPLLLPPSFIQQVACVGETRRRRAERRPVDCSKMAKTST